MHTCPKCQSPVYSNIQDVAFVSGHSPVVTFTIRIQAHWCPRPDCFQKVVAYNYHDHERGEFIDEMLHAKEALRPIAEGMIKRGRRVSQYDSEPSMRKTTIKDSRGIAQRVVDRMNKAINNFMRLD